MARFAFVFFSQLYIRQQNHSPPPPPPTQYVFSKITVYMCMFENKSNCWLTSR